MKIREFNQPWGHEDKSEQFVFLLDNEDKVQVLIGRSGSGNSLLLVRCRTKW